MASIEENLRATLLSLKQISDRVKSLVLTSVTKSEATANKNALLAAIGNIPSPDLSSLATEANATTNKNAVIAAIPSVSSIQSGLAKTSELPDVSGLATASALSSVATDAASAASDAAAAKTAAQGISGYALQGSNTAKTNTQLSSEIADVATLIGYTISEIDNV